MKGLLFDSYRDAVAAKDAAHSSHPDRGGEFPLLYRGDFVLIVIPEDLLSEFPAAVDAPEP